MYVISNDRTDNGLDKIIIRSLENTITKFIWIEIQFAKRITVYIKLFMTREGFDCANWYMIKSQYSFDLIKLEAQLIITPLVV